MKRHSKKELKEYLRYEKQTGKIFWKEKNYGRHRTGREAGSITSNGYRRVVLDQESYMVHRLIWFLEIGRWPQVIDHIDGDPLNNKISNLRNGSQSDNCKNRIEHREGRLLGVSFHKTRKTWISQIWINGKHRELGRFKTEREAHRKYLEAANAAR